MKNPFSEIHEKLDEKIDEIREYVLLKVKIAVCKTAISANCDILNDIDPEHAAEYDAIRGAIKAIK